MRNKQGSGTIVNVSDCTLLDVNSDAVIVGPDGDLVQRPSLDAWVHEPIHPNGALDATPEPTFINCSETDEIVWMLRGDLEFPAFR